MAVLLLACCVYLIVWLVRHRHDHLFDPAGDHDDLASIEAERRRLNALRKARR